MKKIAFLTLLLILGASTAHAGEVSHFTPGVANIRDLVVPAPGLYPVIYNYGYTSGRLNDADGNEIFTVTIGGNGGPSVTLPANKDINSYTLAPTLVWVTPWKILGAKYGAIISPSFSNTSLDASLTSLTGSARQSDQSQFGVGDMFVSPVWLGWTMEHWDVALGYGFYAPIGKYSTETFFLPVVGPKHVESTDNIGSGFWTNQFQGALTFYPWVDKSLAVATAVTYEINTNKDDFDLTPGQNVTFNWGLSEQLPLQASKELLLEFGPKGYSSWQTTDDSGFDASYPSVKDEVHAVGAQIGLAYVPWNNASLNFLYHYEFAADDRFQGQSFGLNFAIKAL